MPTISPAKLPARRKKPVDANTALFKALCRTYRLPAPVLEHQFAALDEPPRKWRFDFAWPAQRLAIEVDGGIWTQGRHTRGAGWLKDQEKMNEAVAKGWRVLHFTPQQLCNLNTLILVGRALGAKP